MTKPSAPVGGTQTSSSGQAGAVDRAASGISGIAATGEAAIGDG
jgi:hypothetical protein